MKVGDKTSWERTFTKEDVTLFAQVSGDYGIHHLEEDEQGRVMLQGLLTATLPTKLGGDLNYIARTLTFEFLRPVFTGDTIRCDNIITSYDVTDGRINMSAHYTCINQHGKEVLRGDTSGVIFNPR
ncbi:MAG TPA: enoyl-CoA hydratase [Ktedonobacteraceae bacterium]|nr:enoyl-CoA hydratase [Ktedonobacteraceae bacterium]